MAACDSSAQVPQNQDLSVFPHLLRLRLCKTGQSAASDLDVLKSTEPGVRHLYLVMGLAGPSPSRRVSRPLAGAAVPGKVPTHS